MADRSRSSELEDPLEGYSGLSLFPRTFNFVPNPPRPYEPDDLQHTHNFLKSMPLTSPSKLLEQAKAIVDSSSELVNSEMPNNIALDKNEDFAGKVVENPQERRPGLDRKRARFSLKPNISQPIVSLEPSLDIGKLKDPEEFFLAYEKFENAQREWQKQTGGILTEKDQNSQITRPRRPGIFGKRSVKYKHRYSTDAPSQDIVEEETLSPSGNSLQQETTNANVTSQERELGGSVAKTEKRVNELLDELLAGSYEELDGDGAVNILQEYLQIKPIELEKLSLPDLQDVPRIDFNASVANLPKPRHVLPDIHNLIKEISSRTPGKKRQAESSAYSRASPTPPKSVLASIPLLKKRILQSTPTNDPFSALDVDQSPAKNASPVAKVSRQSDQVDAGKDLFISCKMKSPMVGENDTACLPDIHNLIKEISSRTPGKKRQAESSAYSLASPTPPQSVLASIPLLKKRIVQSTPTNDPFSALDVDQSPAKNASPVAKVSKQSDQVDAGKDLFISCKMKSPVVGENDTACLPDIHNLIKEISSRTPGKKRQAESSAYSLASPTPPKSVLASIPLLKKRILQSTPTNDPFSALDVDQSPAKNASPVAKVSKQSDQVDAGKDLFISCKMKSPVVEENDTAIADAISSDVVTRDMSGPSDKSTGVHVGSSGYHSGEGNDGSSCMDDTIINGNLSRPDDIDVCTVEPNELGDMGDDMLEEAVGPAEPDLGIEDSIVGESNHIPSQMDQSEPSAVEESARDEASNTTYEGLEQQNEKVENEQNKWVSRPSKTRESKALSRRQSLAGAGTSWESGVRRSTRIRSRPLEYWKGERFLYGRIHESLATVIGIKYESPTTSKAAGKPNLKVKSFVSDKYKDLVELTALH
ncbi:centromere protein C isoform X1 [Carica papaya]|uniref:centromere protein C isoform X1 n=1 Tax=Carica papaya TaxID=3649 RepID=UPI000B8CAC31|nr:centromere protein C isoform X1 [Carica papaya]